MRCHSEATVDNQQDNKLTINKVAELCGVSKTTISRFLNGKYDNMSPETKERISAVIAGLDYHPNRSAQRLKAQKAMLIGCVVADVGSPFSAIMLKGIAKYCEQAGYHVLFADSREDPARERKAIQGFLENGVDGLLINTTGGNEELLSELRQKLPVVLVDRLVSSSEFDDVSSPNYDTAFNTTELMFNMGYDRIAFVSEEIRNITPRRDRREGYRAACKKHGKESVCFEFSAEESESCIDFLTDYTAKHPGERLGLLCVNGVTALHALMGLMSLGVTTGYNFGFCTFDDWNWLMLARPSISTIQLGTEEKGIEAAKLLIQRINKSGEIGEEAQHVIVPAHLVLRSSMVSVKTE